MFANEGADHAFLATSLALLGSAWEGLGEDGKAKRYYLRCVTQSSAVYGLESLVVADLFLDLARVAARSGDEKAAYGFLLKASDTALAASVEPEAAADFLSKVASARENCELVFSKHAKATKAV